MTDLYTVLFFIGIFCAGFGSWDAWHGKHVRLNSLLVLLNVICASANGHMAGLY